MAYVGNSAQTAFTSFDKQTITGDGTATYTLSHSVANDQEVEVFVNNVRQEGGSGKAYTVSGNQITFSENIASTDDCYVVFQGKALQTVVPPAGSVTDSMITGLSSSKLTGALPALDGSALTGVSGGKVLQVVQSYVDTTSSQVISAATPTALTALTVDITPSATDSKIFLFGRLFAETSSTSVANQMVFFYRDSTALRPDTTGLGARPTGLSMVAMGNYGTDAASTPDTTSFFHLDSPATTSQITYKIGYTHNDGGTLYINRSVTDANSTGYERGASVIIAVEIGA